MLTDKERQKRADKKLEQKIATISHGILSELGVAQTYDILIFVRSKLKPGPANKGREVAAQVDGTWPYRDIIINCDRKWAKESGSEYIREVIVHEILHEVLYGFVKHERVTEERGPRDTAYTFAEENAVDLVTKWLMKREVSTCDSVH